MLVSAKETCTLQDNALDVHVSDQVEPLDELMRMEGSGKAIADRARWRADERRWVRQGKLPRCGWTDESVPESPQWTALAPEREKERKRLEEKREKVWAELQTP
jgi:hypothetical protein